MSVRPDVDRPEVDRPEVGHVEVNFDGLVGPTHHYGGLAWGNVASSTHAGSVSRPRAAALQGLAKMRALSDRGVPQGVLPPHDRPDLHMLRALGFAGDDRSLLEAAHHADPHLLDAVWSASAMWAANAATVSPSPDTEDGRVHLTVANLSSQLHRSMEADQTGQVLRATFPDEGLFAVHPPLPAALGDEGAANHTRLTTHHGVPGVEVFVYGRPGETLPKRFPGRQHRRASEAVARTHGLKPEMTCFVQQHPDAIDAGAFHNDVIAVGHKDVLLVHEGAWVDQPAVIDGLRLRIPSLRVIEVPATRVSIEQAVATYLFNSQIVDVGDATVLVAPREVGEDPAVRAYATELVEDDTPIDELLLFDLRQSMRNGGGPACLRLRVALNRGELAAVNRGSLFDDALHSRLEMWIERHYREELHPDDLRDPALISESREALDQLTQILGLGSVYDFQL